MHTTHAAGCRLVRIVVLQVSVGSCAAVVLYVCCTCAVRVLQLCCSRVTVRDCSLPLIAPTATAPPSHCHLLPPPSQEHPQWDDRNFAVFQPHPAPAMPKHLWPSEDWDAGVPGLRGYHTHHTHTHHTYCTNAGVPGLHGPPPRMIKEGMVGGSTGSAHDALAMSERGGGAPLVWQPVQGDGGGEGGGEEGCSYRLFTRRMLRQCLRRTGYR
jgi:hypothetical protein